MQIKRAINPGAVRDNEPWLVIVCNVQGKRILESHFTKAAADKAAIIVSKHDLYFGHRNQYVVRHRSEVEIIA